MNLNFEQEAKLHLNKFSKLGTWYILALSVVATVITIGQLLIQDHLNNQLSDSRVVNVAGKQRMLSQKLTKSILLLAPDQSLEKRNEIQRDLHSTLKLWKLSQDGLLHGNDSLKLKGNNSDTVSARFRKVEPHFDKMYQSASHLLISISKEPLINFDSLRNDISVVLKHEGYFLKGMEVIVLRYDLEARERVAMLSNMEYLLLVISIIVILLEIFFVFRPTTYQVNQTVNKLIASEKNAQKLTKEIGELYASLENSYEQLSHVNQPTENPRLYAKGDKGGNIFFISDLFTEISGKKPDDAMRICDLFEGMKNEDDWMDEIIERVSDGNSWQGSVHYLDKNNDKRWAEIMVLPVFSESDEVEELQVFGSDMTKQKYAELNMRKKTRAEIEKKINEQKFRSVLILEGQEEERKRIAMDIHDGIGQQLTSLKFQIESLPVSSDESVEAKINEIKLGIKDVIKEVRRVTFNLKPTVLGDYGLQAALSVFIREIGKLSDIELTYQTVGDISVRLPQKVENNIFRIVQEAINNSIKYSGANKIEVTLKQNPEDIEITVSDQGSGFDEKIVEARSVNIESGRGFFNMYERTEYINGKLEIKSDPGMGTTVILTVPLRSAVPA
ncbi:MAG TPA: ATP-binding protein [Cyclobacteriaceae bacterium]|nr:ATP-binding protein [Cyclobacteriaceae bacterium]